MKTPQYALVVVTVYLFVQWADKQIAETIAPLLAFSTLGYGSTVLGIAIRRLW